MKRRWFATLAALALLTLAVAPFLSADRFRGGIQAALETALGRKVEITGKVRFSVWSGLGFSIGDVVIHEDPQYGIEPFAYVSSLNAVLSLTAALGGRLQVDRIVLDEPVVNLVKLDTGSWNVRPLLARTPAPERREHLPEIRVRSGRLKLKFGDTKSVLYATNADVDIAPESEAEVRIRFSLEPARTDRAAQGIGTLSGHGRYRLFPDKPGEIDLDIELERSALSEIATLLEGRGASLRGFLASRARIAGPLSGMKIEGSVRLDDIQRFDLFRAGSGDWPIRYSGRLDFPAGNLELETRPVAAAPFHLRLRATSLAENPKWGAVLRFNELPMGALREVLQYLDVDLPRRVEIEGKLSGVLGYSRAHGLQGLVAMDNATAKTAEITAALTNAVFVLDRERFRLQPARLSLGGAPGLEIEGSYTPAAQWFAVRSVAPVPLASVMAAYRPFADPGGIPLLGRLAKGEWRGSLRYEQTGDAAAQWSGSFSIRRAALPLAGLSVPVEIASAQGLLQAGRVRLDGIEASAGGIGFEASYRQDAGDGRPHRLHVAAAEADVRELERLFAPTLRRGGGLLRTFSLRSAVPEWLRQRRVEAAVEIGSLWAVDSWLGSASARLVWDGARVELTNAYWEREQASATGRVQLSLEAAEPAYRASLNVKDLGWKGGWIDGEGIFETSGTGSALLRNARSSGRFYARELFLSSEGDFQTASGAFELTAPRGAPVLKLTSIEAVSGIETYSGQGASENDGRLFVDLASGRKKIRMAGTVWPFQLEPAAR
jgi:hypothetical protein